MRKLWKHFVAFMTCPYKDIDKMTAEQLAFISRFGR